jgi:hypothetical protein
MAFVRSLSRRYVGNRFTVLLATLLLAIAGHGLTGRLLPLANPLDWLMGISLIAVVFSTQNRTLRWVLGALVTAGAAGRLTQGWLEHPLPGIASQSLAAAAFLVAAGVAVRRALATGPVDAEHVAAALDAYLLVGFAFGIVYSLLESTLPGSFAVGSGAAFSQPRAIYFSFVTQATLGFGDIVPVREEAQGLVVAQGIGGQMYLAVLVARLVSLYSAEPKRAEPKRAEPER